MKTCQKETKDNLKEITGNKYLNVSVDSEINYKPLNKITNHKSFIISQISDKKCDAVQHGYQCKMKNQWQKRRGTWFTLFQ